MIGDPSIFRAENTKFVDAVGQSINQILKGNLSHKVIPAKTCPISRMHIDTCMTTCGLDMLGHLMKFSIPKLGANVDISGEVTLLCVCDGQTLGQFVTSCSQVEYHPQFWINHWCQLTDATYP